MFLTIMKKLFSISLAILILLSGMHMTVAAHYCQGNLAAIKVSASGKHASCGMTHDVHADSDSRMLLSSNCCENKIDVYSVDNNYSSSDFHLKEITQSVFHVFYIPEGFFFESSASLLISPTNVGPPVCFQSSSVNMADICVFRI